MSYYTAAEVPTYDALDRDHCELIADEVGGELRWKTVVALLEQRPGRRA